MTRSTHATGTGVLAATKTRVLQTERRGLFRGFAILLGIAFAIAAFGAPVVKHTGVSPANVAVIVVGAEILLLAIGLGWLLRVVSRGRVRAPTKRKTGQAPES
jgi:cytochrome c biogenesis protein CcdA